MNDLKKTARVTGLWYLGLAITGSKLWSVAGLFFGLWLIPMGYVAATSGRLPKGLGLTLIVGGGGYLVSAFLANGLAKAPSWLVDGLTLPATFGEFWMIGYLLFVGIRPSSEALPSSHHGP